MPNFSGIWNLKEQVQAIAVERWTGLPLYELYTWGSRNLGRLGDGSSSGAMSSPIQIGALTDWNQVSAGDSHNAAIKTDGTLWAWGGAACGRLGNSSTSPDRVSPIQIGALTDWHQVSAHTNHTAAIKTNGTIWAWGAAAYGQLGGNSTVQQSSPVQVGALTNWSYISAGFQMTAAIKSNGTLWTWGRNQYGDLGQNIYTGVCVSSPVQVGALTNWAQISATCRNHAAAVKTDGTLWAWGRNNNGQIGNNTTISRSSPVQIGTLTNWSHVSVGSFHTVAIKTNCTLWAWGDSSTGALGLGVTNILRSSPVQVGALTNWFKVDVGDNHNIAIKTDGTLWGWGRNNNGQIGDNTTIDRSSPVQISAMTTWFQVSAGRYHSASIFKRLSN
jgi:alpha-tubulin suppressor-like RCC1 family protein